MKIQLKRSDKLSNSQPVAPSVGSMEYGELAVNYNASDPTIFIKDSSDNIIEIASSDAYAQGQLWSNNGSKLYPTDLQSSIGIGTNNPAAPLTIQNGTSAEIRLIRTNNSNNFSSISSSGVNSEQLKLISAASGSIELVVGTTVGAHVDSSGNIGIKKTNPTVALDVSGAGKFSNKVTSAATTSSDPSGTLATKGYVDATASQVVQDNVIWTENRTTGKIHPARISSYVGIGQQNPTVRLDVNGDFKVSGFGTFGNKARSALTVAGDLNSTLTTKSYVDAQDAALKSDLENQINNGVTGGTFWSLSGNNLRPKSNDYNVSIGRSTARDKLDVEGNGRFSGSVTTRLTQTTDANSVVTTKNYVDAGINALLASIPGEIGGQVDAAQYWTRASGKLYPRYNDNVGIGVSNPTQKLDVNGNIAATGVVYSRTTTAGDGATTLTTKNYVDNKVNGIDFWRRSNGNVYLETTGDKVGIGTNTPSAKLHVNGDIRATNFLINLLPSLP